MMPDKTRDDLQAENDLLKKQLVDMKRRYESLSVADDLPVMVWQSDVNKNCIYTNQYAQEFTAIEPEKKLGFDWIDGVHPDDRALVLDTYFSAFDARRPFETEYRLKGHDGEYHWMLIRGKPQFAGMSEFTGYVGACVDITERRHTERTLQQTLDELEQRVRARTAELTEAEEKWRSLVATVPDFIMILQRNGAIQFINRTVEGFKMEDVIGTPCYDFLEPEYRQPMRDCVERVFESGEFDRCEIVGAGPNNSSRWYSIRMGPFREQERTVGVTVIANDITEQKRTEQALIEETEFSSHIVTQAPTIVCGVLPDGTTVWVNRAITTAAGYEPEEVIGKNWWDLFYPGEEYRQVEKLMADFEATPGPVVNYDMVLTAKDGSKRTISWNSVNRFDADGNLLEIIGIGADITDRKLAEEKLVAEQQLLRKLLDLQERERQTISLEIHDGFVQYAVGAKMSLEGLAHQLARSNDSSQSQNTLREHYQRTTELLGRAIDEGRRMIGDLRPMIIDEQGIVEAIHYLVADDLGADQVQVTFTHDVDFVRLNPMVEAALFRIVQEALTNVRRHSESKTATLHLAQDGDRLRLEIVDNGIGFDVDKVPGDHFGVRGIVERARLFGGIATINSMPGRGTRITVEMPVVEADESE